MAAAVEMAAEADGGDGEEADDGGGGKGGNATKSVVKERVRAAVARAVVEWVKVVAGRVANLVSIAAALPSLPCKVVLVPLLLILRWAPKYLSI